MSSIIERIISRGQLVTYCFEQDAVAASQSAVAIPINENGATTGTTASIGFVVPWPGMILGVGVTLSAAGSAGALSVAPTVDTTADTDGTVSITTEAAKSTKVARGLIPFAAGAVLGAKLTTDGSWNGTTSDLSVVLYVILDLEGV